MKGIDISNHNGNINWSKVKADGVEAVYIKATEGTTYQDPWLNSHYAGAKGVGLPTGFYHFLVGTSQPESQAHNFYNQIKDKKNDLLPCLDIEVSGFDVGDYALRFLKKFKELSGMGMVIYTGAYFSRDNLIMEIKKNYPLWLAHYGVEPWKSNLVTLAGFTTLVGHQYTETGRVAGINTNVDMNVFNESIFNAPINKNVNSWVKKMQEECNRQGFSSQTVDGIPGPNTLAGCPTLRHGASGNITKLLQEKLISLGYSCGPCSTDGEFGNATRVSVMQFQKDNGLEADGVVGQKTWRKLLAL